MDSCGNVSTQNIINNPYFPSRLKQVKGEQSVTNHGQIKLNIMKVSQCCNLLVIFWNQNAVIQKSTRL